MNRFLSLLLCFCLSGCFQEKKRQLNFLMPEYKIENVAYHGPKKSIHRVVVLPIQSYTEAIRSEDLKQLQDIFYGALLEKRCFECVFMKQTDLTEELFPFKPISKTILQRLQVKYTADAILFLGVTCYSPYVPMKIGIRTQLFSIDEERIVWSLDEMFDSRREDVSCSLQKFQARKQLYTFESLNNLGQISPREFASYVAEKIWFFLAKYF